ncbi:MAG TPA: type III pantothenate kinase [Chromatiales bacterium]|nr:type III pantothenate kinase [Chromatiales bacterium]
MRLLADLGNTRLRWAVLGDDGTLGRTAAVVHGGRGLEPVLDAAWSGLAAPDAVLVCSVAGEDAAGVLAGWCRRRWGVEVTPVRAAAEGWGVRNAYHEPGRLGADRWAALVAARGLFPDRPVCIVDCGTAATVDALAADGTHLGGLIAPGLGLMRRALASGTAGVAEAEALGGRPQEVALLARSTRDAVTAGTLHCLAAFVARAGADVGEALGPGTVRVLTGGDATALLPLLDEGWRHEPALVLRGLARMALEPAGVERGGAAS